MTLKINEENVFPRFFPRGARLDFHQVDVVLGERLERPDQRTDFVFYGKGKGRFVPARRANRLPAQHQEPGDVLSSSSKAVDF